MHNSHEQLLGRWVGQGAGEYPTIQPFSYRETLEVVAVADKPLARWSSTTTDELTGEPRHSEVGFVRSAGDSCELMLAHVFGVTELSLATPTSAGSFDFESISIACSPTAKEITAVRRSITLRAEVLEYRVSMAAVGLGMTHHLSARLERA